MKVITINDFINEIIEEYSISNDKKTIDKLRKKITRTLQEQGKWDNAKTITLGQNRPSKIFTYTDLENVKYTINEYLLKLSSKNIDFEQELSRHDYFTDFGEYGRFFDDEYNTDPNLISVRDELIKRDEHARIMKQFNKTEIMELMVTALFNAQFDINYKLWANDKAYKKNYQKQLKDIIDQSKNYVIDGNNPNVEEEERKAQEHWNNLTDEEKQAEIELNNKYEELTKKGLYDPLHNLIMNRLDNPLEYVIKKKSKK